MHLSQLCYVGLCDPNFRVEEETDSFTPSLPPAFPRLHGVNQSSPGSTGEIPACRSSLAVRGQSPQLRAAPPQRPDPPTAHPAETLRFGVSGSCSQRAWQRKGCSESVGRAARAWRCGTGLTLSLATSQWHPRGGRSVPVGHVRLTGLCQPGTAHGQPQGSTCGHQAPSSQTLP